MCEANGGQMKQKDLDYWNNVHELYVYRVSQPTCAGELFSELQQLSRGVASADGSRSFSILTTAALVIGLALIC
jgi:hypothetical protein